MTKVRAPVLLDNYLNDVRRLEPSTLRLNLNLSAPSTADMTIPFDRDAPVPVRSWIRLYDIHGNAGIYRVSASDTEYDTEEQRLTLEHGITSLRDIVIPSPADSTEDSEIKYVNGSTTRAYTASEMLSYILSQQFGFTRWQAGTCAATENVILDRDDSTLFDMLLEMMDQLPEYDLAFDQTTDPWTVSIVTKATDVTAEGRLSRNLGSVRVTYDDSELCTRVFFNTIDDGDYVTHSIDANVHLYGIVEHSIYLNSDTKKADGFRIATCYLEKHKEPAISVELDAVDLSLATGEEIDAFALGKKFRLTIPSYGLIVDQWITGIEYSDVYGDPEHLTLTLGNRIADLSQRAAKTSKKARKASTSASGGGGGGARGAAKSAKDVNDAFTYFRQNDYAITIGAIDTRLGTAESQISIQAGEIALKVSKDGVISAINMTPETIKISANKINLEGYVTASNLAASIAALTSVSATNLTVTGSFFVGANNAKWQTVSVVTTVSGNSERAPATGSIALTNNGTSVSGGTSFNYIKSVTVKHRDLYFLGMDTGGEY